MKWESDLLITSMITDRIGRYEVQLPINQNCKKICEKNNYRVQMFWRIKTTVPFVFYRVRGMKIGTHSSATVLLIAIEGLRARSS